MGNLTGRSGPQNTGDMYFGTRYTIQKNEAKFINAPVIKKFYYQTPEYAAAAKPSTDIGSCCKTIDGDGYKLCDVFETKLKRFYSKLALPTVAWLKEGQKLSIDEHFIQPELNESKKPIKIEEVFSWVKNKPPLRILIEGQPGFGKTTLAIKLAHDWAINKEYINFKFAFLVFLRDLKQRSFEAAIEEIGNRCDSHDIVRIIGNHKSRTLFILDGLDELTPKDRRKILDILVGSKYSNVTVIAFCRTGLFRLSSNECLELYGSFEMQDDFSDKRIYIMGITSSKKKKKFLEKFLPKATIKEIIVTLSSQWASYNSPLLLMLLAIISQEVGTIHNFTTKTALFKQLFNHILKQSFTTLGLKLDNDFDLFRLNSSLNSIQEQMKQFGNLAMQQICESNYKYETNDLTNAIYAQGFFFKREQITVYDRKSHYEVFHPTIVEFAAAFALWIELKFNESALVEKNLTLVMNHFLKTGGTSLIVPFVASLMEDELDLLFSHIKSYYAWFSYFNDFLAAVLSECSPINIHRSELMKNFISHYISSVSNYFRSNDEMCRKMLKYGTECEKFELIEIDTETKLEMFPDEIRTRLRIHFELNSDAEFQAYSTVPCKPSEIFSHLIPFENSLSECLRFAASSNCESCNLEFQTYEASSKFLQLISKHEVFSKIKYHQLDIIISSEFEKQVVMKLLKNNQVELLQLTLVKQKKTFVQRCFQSCFEKVIQVCLYHFRFFSQPFFRSFFQFFFQSNVQTSFEFFYVTFMWSLVNRFIFRYNFPSHLQFYFRSFFYPKTLDMKDFSIAATKSQCLAYICLNGFAIDLYDLTNGGNKKYSYMSLIECTVSCRKSLSNRKCIHHLLISAVTNPEVIVETEPSAVDLFSPAVIINLVKKYPSWTGFESVKTLRWMYLQVVIPNPFTNLQTLQISVSVYPDVEQLANWIHTLPIINLVIQNHLSIGIPKLFKCINNLWANKKTQLETITLFESFAFCYEYADAYELLLGLSCSYWDTVNFIGGKHRDIDKLVEFVSNLDLVVNFSSFTCKSMYLEDVPIFNHFALYIDGMLCITRKSNGE